MGIYFIGSIFPYSPVGKVRVALNQGKRLKSWLDPVHQLFFCLLQCLEDVNKSG